MNYLLHKLKRKTFGIGTQVSEQQSKLSFFFLVANSFLSFVVLPVSMDNDLSTGLAIKLKLSLRSSMSNRYTV